MASIAHITRKDKPVKPSQPPQVSNTLEFVPAALTCTKNINDCPGSALNFIVRVGQSFIFFALILYLLPVKTGQER